MAVLLLMWVVAVQRAGLKKDMSTLELITMVDLDHYRLVRNDEDAFDYAWWFDQSHQP